MEHKQLTRQEVWTTEPADIWKAAGRGAAPENFENNKTLADTTEPFLL